MLSCCSFCRLALHLIPLHSLHSLHFTHSSTQRTLSIIITFTFQSLTLLLLPTKLFQTLRGFLLLPPLLGGFSLLLQLSKSSITHLLEREEELFNNTNSYRFSIFRSGFDWQ